jgi:hypothetical protein
MPQVIRRTRIGISTSEELILVSIVRLPNRTYGAYCYYEGPHEPISIYYGSHYPQLVRTRSAVLDALISIMERPW